MRTAQPRLSLVPVGARAALVVGLIVLGWVAVSRSFAATVRADAPEVALASVPNDSVALGTLASRLLADPKEAARRTEAQAMARRGVVRDATSVSAVVALAMDAEVHRDVGQEARLFDYSQQLSRRDMTTQVYFIQSAVAQGSIGEALRHYDIALRTSPAAPALMFPVLQAALSDGRLRRGVAELLVKQPPWGPGFLQTIANTGSNFIPALALLYDLRRAGMRPPADVENATMANLVGTRPDLAWRYYVGSHHGADELQPVNGNFRRVTTDGSPFDWQLTSDNGIEATLDRADGKGFLSFNVPATAAGVVAKQLRVFPPGSYRFETVAADIAGPKTSQPYWQLMCTDGRPLGSVEIGTAPASGALFAGTVSVPGDCKAQWLQLVARPTDAIAGGSGEIDRISVTRVG